MGNIIEWITDTNNILVIIGGIFAITISVHYFLSDTSDTLPTFMKTALSMVIAAGVLVYLLMLNQTRNKEKHQVVKSEVAGNR